MLALPQFDTYDILKEYARDPLADHARLGLHLLRQMARDNILWQMVGMLHPGSDLHGLLNLRMGIAESREVPEATKLFSGASDLTTEERDNIYMKLCAQAGIQVRQEDIDNMRKTTRR